MRGKLIVIEAGDGCGKATQAKALVERLCADGLPARRVSFPDYESDSSALVKMYLNGEFGRDVQSVNAYAASLFYAVDRFASYRRRWREWYEQGEIIVADRYTTSNMVHQAVKIGDAAKRKAYLDWLWDLEFVKLELPVPDAVFFLDLPPSFSAQLLAARAQGKHEGADLHEADAAYLARCYEAYCELAQLYGWRRIDCVDAAGLKSVERIHEAIYRGVRAVCAENA